jgi:hypothetical protein
MLVRLARLAAVAALAASTGMLAASHSRHTVLRPGAIEDEAGAWETRSFEGSTHYREVTLDGERVLRATSRGTASLLYRRTEVDLTETPYMVWTWRVDARPTGHDERTKAGDDFPARVYAASSEGWGLLGLEAVNYVWSHSEPKGASWTSPHSNDSRIVVVAPARAETGEWRREVRNVRRDFQRLFGHDVRTLDGVGVMADTDDTGGRSSAFFGEIYFTDSPPGDE